MVLPILPALGASLFQGSSSRRKAKRSKRSTLQFLAGQEFNRRRGQLGVREQLNEIIGAGGVGLTPEALAGAQQSISGGFADIGQQLSQRISSAAGARGASRAGTTQGALGQAELQVGKAEQGALSNLGVQNELAKRQSLMDALGLKLDLRNLDAQQARDIFGALQGRKQQELQGDIFRGQFFQGLLSALGQLSASQGQAVGQFQTTLSEATK